MKKSSTSWEPVKKWYHSAVGEEGHYYHKHVILPGVMRLLSLDEHANPSLLDLACGQGILARHLPENIPYIGIDASPSLIKEAKKSDPNSIHEYFVADVTKNLPKQKGLFTHATIILALQNIEKADLAIKNAAMHLQKNGKLIIVLNHPCFRIPRQSSWHVDQENKVQYRRIDRYLTSMKIPIQAHPSKAEKSPQTWTFHHPVSSYSNWLFDAGFCIEHLEEWCSDKVSTGAAAKMENRSRAEFPLFLTIVARKIK